MRHNGIVLVIVLVRVRFPLNVFVIVHVLVLILFMPGRVLALVVGIVLGVREVGGGGGVGVVVGWCRCRRVVLSSRGFVASSLCFLLLLSVSWSVFRV